MDEMYYFESSKLKSGWACWLKNEKKKKERKLSADKKMQKRKYCKKLHEQPHRQN